MNNPHGKPAGVLSLIWPWSRFADLESERDAHAFASKENKRVSEEVVRRLREKSDLCEIQRNTIRRQDKLLARASFRNAKGQMAPKGTIPENVEEEVAAEIKRDRAQSGLVKRAVK